MRIGAEEHLECLQHVAHPGPHGESVCLGYKYSYYELGLPAYVSDDGYVLRVEGEDRFYPLDASQIAADQKAGLLPDPLPSYSLPTSAYVFGFSLWPVVALIALLSVWQARRKRKRVAVERAIPIDTAGPRPATEADRYIEAQVAPQLREGERITHQGYGTDRAIAGSGMSAFASAARAKGLFVALTDQRLFLIQTRIGAFAPLLENKGVETIERAMIKDATSDDHTIAILLADGTTRTIAVDLRKKKYFSNQDAFLRDLPRLLARAPAAETGAG